MRAKIVKKPIISIPQIIAIIFVIASLIVLFQQSSLKKELIEKKAALEKEILVLEGETKALNDELSNSNSLEFIERVAREDYGMVKPDEIIYIDLNNK